MRRREEPLLTEILPVVDNFGVVVAEQNAWDVQPEHASARLQINTLRVRRGDPDLLKQRAELVEALAAVFERRMRSDRINNFAVYVITGGKFSIDMASQKDVNNEIDDEVVVKLNKYDYSAEVGGGCDMFLP